MKRREPGTSSRRTIDKDAKRVCERWKKLGMAASIRTIPWWSN